MDEIPPAESSQVLSQSEVEQLVSQVQAGESPATLLKPGGQKTQISKAQIQSYDFRQPAFLAGGELRKIKLRHEDFIRTLAAHLSVYLRLEVTMQIAKLQTMTYDKFLEGLASPTHITLFKVEPLKGVCLLDMAPRLALTIVDRLLGGPANSVSASGELSDIETALLDQVSQQILGEWCRLWPKLEKPRPVLLGHESSGRFLNTSPHDCSVLVLAIEVRLGDCAEQLQLAFPFYTVEPLIRQAEAGREPAPGAPAPRMAAPVWNPSYSDVQLQINTECQGLELTARELANLRCGDVLTFDATCLEKVEVSLERLPRFVGRLGTRGKNWAVELTAMAKT